MDRIDLEVPGTSPKKKRNPQKRDRMATEYANYSGHKKSGRTWERLQATKRKADELMERGYVKEASVIADAMDISIRGTYEITRESEDMLLSMCQAVINGEASHLIEAQKIVNEAVKEINGEAPFKLQRAKDNMYRIVSSHNKSSVLLFAQDLIELSEIIQSNMAELQEKVSEEG